MNKIFTVISAAMLILISQTAVAEDVSGLCGGHGITGSRGVGTAGAASHSSPGCPAGENRGPRLPGRPERDPRDKGKSRRRKTGRRRGKSCGTGKGRKKRKAGELPDEDDSGRKKKKRGKSGRSSEPEDAGPVRNSGDDPVVTESVIGTGSGGEEIRR
ncbi:hypothetical protein QUF80_04705 [Desulfococcaceae bacterium HSG8]|nr:hypothetical protein [Desulfococcaceae bacterium HSG8]